ncbi:MAG: nuclear transport factor 2 family protein, partial [Bacteroides sp.]|nr:nuclear transport factor 2 family protein [Bacteroides sp.]MCM1447262.1 nuclear transport factor 2 family protein [Bacteroides sp.]
AGPFFSAYSQTHFLTQYQELFTYYDATGKQSASYEVSQYSIAGNVAMVRIESKFGETEFSDMFTLAKNGKDWKIVSKVYYMK